MNEGQHVSHFAVLRVEKGGDKVTNICSDPPMCQALWQFMDWPTSFPYL